VRKRTHHTLLFASSTSLAAAIAEIPRVFRARFPALNFLGQIVRRLLLSVAVGFPLFAQVTGLLREFQAL